MSTTRHLVPAELWEDPRHLLGVWGERVALAYLVERGWVMEAHRFRFGRQEIDLIVRRDHLVAFVEVKTRQTMRYGSGLEAVSPRKQRVVTRVAAFWALRYGRSADIYRFDVIGVRRLKGAAVEVSHIEDAWRA